MKINLQELTTSQAIMAIIGLIIFLLAFGLGFAWLLLLTWNLLASSAGFSLIPVNWLTVIATMILIYFARRIFRITE